MEPFLGFLFWSVGHFVYLYATPGPFIIIHNTIQATLPNLSFRTLSHILGLLLFYINFRISFVKSCTKISLSKIFGILIRIAVTVDKLGRIDIFKECESSNMWHGIPLHLFRFSSLPFNKDISFIPLVAFIHNTLSTFIQL